MGDEITKYIWVKYRHRFAYGTDKKWQYIEVPDFEWMRECGYGDKGQTDEKILGEWLMEEERVGDQYDYSDKYRGIEYEQIDHPPVDEIMRRLKNHKDNITHHQILVGKYQRMLDELGHVTKGDFSV